MTTRIAWIGFFVVALVIGAGMAQAGVLFVSDIPSATIWRFDATTGAPLSTFASGGPLIAPVGLTFGPGGDLFVSDFGSDSILRYSLDGTFLGVFANVSFPIMGAFGPDGNFYVSSAGDNAVEKFDGVTGAFISQVVPTDTLMETDGIRFGPDGYLYVADSLSNTITRYALDGTPLGTFISGPELDGVSNLIFGLDGTVYVSNSNASNILHYSPSGVFIDVLGSTSPLAPFGLTLSPDGSLYAGCGCLGDGEILRFNINTKQSDVLVPAGTNGLADVEDVLFSEVPEPSTFGMLAFGFGLCGFKLLRRRSR